MAYATPADITAVTGETYRDAAPASGSTPAVKESSISLSELQGILDRGMSDINAALSALGIPVPIVAATSPQSFDIVKTANIYYGLHWVKMLSNSPELASMYKTFYDNDLKMIKQGDKDFTDVTKSGDEPTQPQEAVARYNFDENPNAIDMCTIF